WHNHIQTREQPLLRDKNHKDRIRAALLSYFSAVHKLTRLFGCEQPHDDERKCRGPRPDRSSAQHNPAQAASHTREFPPCPSSVARHRLPFYAGLRRFFRLVSAPGCRQESHTFYWRQLAKL